MPLSSGNLGVGVNVDLAGIATKALADDVAARPIVPILYGVVDSEGKEWPSPFTACHRWLYANATNSKTRFKDPAYVYTRHFIRGESGASASDAYAEWLASTVSPYRSLRKTRVPHGWIIPSDQPANLLFNFCIATRAHHDGYAHFHVIPWKRLCDAGIHPTMAFILCSLVAWDSKDVWFLNRVTNGHSPIDAHELTPVSVRRIWEGKPAHPSAFYFSDQVACVPTNIIWTHGERLNNQYRDYIYETYLKKGSSITTERERVFDSAATYGYPAWCNTQHPFDLLVEIGRNEQNHLELQ